MTLRENSQRLRRTRKVPPPRMPLSAPLESVNVYRKEATEVDGVVDPQTLVDETWQCYGEGGHSHPVWHEVIQVGALPTCPECGSHTALQQPKPEVLPDDVADVAPVADVVPTVVEGDLSTATTGQAIVSVLRRSAEPLTTAQLVAAMQDRGWSSEAKDKIKVVGVALGQLFKRTENTGVIRPKYGHYAFKEHSGQPAS